jgi:hypothetical protein
VRAASFGTMHPTITPREDPNWGRNAVSHRTDTRVRLQSGVLLRLALAPARPATWRRSTRSVSCTNDRTGTDRQYPGAGRLSLTRSVHLGSQGSARLDMPFAFRANQR